jgi:hypothetical protein
MTRPAPTASTTTTASKTAPARSALRALGVAVAVAAALVPVVVAIGGCPAPYYDDNLGLDGVPVDAGSLAGTFGLQSTAVDQADVPIFGKVDTGGITASLVHRTWRGAGEPDAYDEVITVCGVENFETAGLLTVVPDATLHAIPQSTAVLHVDHATGAYVRDTYREYWAVRGLDDDKPLPEDKSSDVYYDMDDDGHPGTTIEATGLAEGQVYVAQRKTIDQQGIVRSTDESLGLSHVKKEGVVLDATSDLLKTESQRTPHPDPKQSWFIDVRLDDDAGCDAVVDAQKSGAIPRKSPIPRSD